MNHSGILTRYRLDDIEREYIEAKAPRPVETAETNSCFYACIRRVRSSSGTLSLISLTILLKDEFSSIHSFLIQHRFENGHFQIPQARKSDEGPYQCVATNDAGSHTANVDIYVRETGGGVVTVQISPPEHRGLSGESFTLRCQADGAIDIKWERRDGRPLPYSFIVDRDVLTASSPREEDSGTYVCTATSATGYTVTGTAEVIIYDSQG